MRRVSFKQSWSKIKYNFLGLTKCLSTISNAFGETKFIFKIRPILSLPLILNTFQASIMKHNRRVRWIYTFLIISILVLHLVFVYFFSTWKRHGKLPHNELLLLMWDTLNWYLFHIKNKFSEKMHLYLIRVLFYWFKSMVLRNFS